ncbi:hypothetical protein M0R72_17325 [Candidatus Pacearchaeota archaeon]|jgi:hypothetical protein|nr:hypothetical protein [Candidatus Pacearchaeota archaeon]
MNQFLIDGIPCRAVYRDNPNGFGEERGGCTSMQNGEFRLCEDCELQKDCPDDGEEE